MPGSSSRSSGRPPTMHQLSSGMCVSGPPEQQSKERHPTIGSRAVPYTGGDVRKSGELGKMLNIPTVDPTSSSRTTTSSRSHSGPLQKKTSSGPLSQIPPTGLITSGPAARWSAGQEEPSPKISRKKKEYGTAVTAVQERRLFWFGVPRAGVWAGVVASGLGLAAGIFVLVVVGRVVILVAVAGLVVPVWAVGVWNWVWGRWEVERFLSEYPDTAIDPRNLPVGKNVKVTGISDIFCRFGEDARKAGKFPNLIKLRLETTVIRTLHIWEVIAQRQLVTCGAAPLETSYQNIPRCVYVSTELYEYRGWNGLPANSNHKRFTWGLRHSERHVSDFYISDPNSGTRFLVRAGNGARVASFVKTATIIDMTKKNRELTPTFLSWLTDHNLSSNDHVLRLEEGFIREGGTASVMGILRKHENLIIIDQPRDVTSTGFQWKRCFFPLYVEGLILIGDRTPEGEVCHV